MTAFDLILDAFSAALGWADQLFSESGYLDYFLGILIISIVFNKIISPMLHGRGSDRAQQRNKSQDGDS